MIRRVAVTGATGFIGRHLTAHLLGAGLEVHAIVRPSSPRSAPPGAIVEHAPLDRDRLRHAFKGADAVVHLAGVVSTPRAADYDAVNVEATRAVAAAAREADARLVYVSSLAAAGPAPRAAPRRETDPNSPMTAYGASKLGGETAVAGTAGLSWAIVRPGVVYGPGDRALLPLFRLADRGLLPVIGRRDAAYSFIYVDDLVEIIDALLQASHEGDVVFAAHPQPVDVDTLLTGIEAAVGRPGRRVPVPAPALRLVALAGEAAGALTGRMLPMNRRRLRELSCEGFVCRVERLRDRFGVEARTALEPGLQATAAWYRREGWLSRTPRRR